MAVVCYAVPILADDSVDFEREIAPLLIKRCLSCHNATEAKGKLVLERRENAMKGGENGPAIVPGNARRSHLLERVLDKEMPPEDVGPPLSDDELALLTNWVKAGARWPKGRVLSEFEFTTSKRAGRDWWSFQPPVRPDVPDLKDPWIKTQIDAFVLRSLRSRKLEPSPSASKLTLLRRVTFDLIGLPPTPNEVDAFLSDESPDAYNNVVDRLLKSPRYGERWGRHWLDIAHYADTHGFERDFRRDNAWPYRDYVIRAFNDDKPYNEFIREQIAGDVIDPNRADCVTATGFLGAGPWDVTGLMETKNPVLQRQARANVLDDMVTTVITATMGLTINCSRCHNHKFDPISQQDYYRLSAVFAGVRRADRDVPTPVSRAREDLNRIQASLAKLQGRGIDLADIVGGGDGSGTGMLGNGLDPRNGKPSNGQVGFLPNAKPNGFVKSPTAFVDGLTIPGKSAPMVVSSTGIKLENLPATKGQTWDYVQFGPVMRQETTVIDGIDYNKNGHSLLGLHANKAITFDLDAIRDKHGEKRVRRFLALAAYCGRTGPHRAQFGVYLDGKPVVPLTSITRDDNGIRINVPINRTQRFLTLVSLEGEDGISYDQVSFADPRLHAAKNETLSDAQIKTRTQLLVQRDVLRKNLDSIKPTFVAKKVYAVTTSKPPPVHILLRGNTEALGAQVSPGALAAFKSPVPDFGDTAMPEGARRMALANWIVHPDNPLTRRVIVNRIWQHHFGRGIVSTPSDFGFHGDRPSHPKLLDWLADEFLRRDWSIKQVHRLIVLSSTYRQASDLHAPTTEIDADNRLMWRMTRRRLEAEAVRDSILAVSGKLNLMMGGPGYRDFKYTQRYAPIYKYVTPDRPELWRRTVYRFAVRSVSNPFLDVLDCPNPSNLTPVRNRTTTPLQSLAMMNNAFMIQQAEYFAERIERTAGEDVVVQIRDAYRLAFSREPTDEEAALAQRLVQRQSLFHLCRMLFNANEFVYVD
jgi:hypothetical protein